MTYQRWNNLLGWIAFAIALFVYTSTIEPTASFWDCGEYIATSYRLEVGHPPGAPTFLLVGRLFSMFVAPENVAVMINFLSGLCSAITILFLFWTLTMLAKKIFEHRNKGDLDQGDLLAIWATGFVGALAYTFSDTFWFSGTEGEVYAMSSAMTAITFWAILKWESIADEPQADRWIILISYLIGLSIGIHLLNLLAIPAIAYVIYFKKTKEVNLKGMIITGALGVVTLGGVQGFIIPKVVDWAAKFEFVMVNSLGLPFHVGSIIFMILLMGAVSYGVYYTRKVHKPIWNTALMSFIVLIIGYSSFAIIMIRSNADTPIDENNPENLVNLLAYLNREQYGDSPLLYGQYFNSPLDREEPYSDGDPVYYPDEETGTYVLADDRKSSVPNYADEFKAFFPRMWSTKGNHVKAYKNWSEFEGKPIKYRDVNGQMKTIRKPTFTENMRYFFSYQIGWMYMRYFMWNFSGRQNDTQGHGNFRDGNYLTGVDFLDEPRLGPQDDLPTQVRETKAFNKYYAIPLILGLLGFIFHFARDPKNAWVVTLLFLFTGLAIVVYLNQYPFQPRERDYAYAGSFYAFAIWIGFGVLALYDAARSMQAKELFKSLAYAVGGAVGLALLSSLFGGNNEFTLLVLYITVVGGILMLLMNTVGRFVKSGVVQAALALVICLSAPYLMATENWDDHDRSGRYTARAIAKNYLDSCEKDAILFTNGDNDTFPLWYLQEVEGYRTDVRIVNLTLASTDWFIDMIKRQAYEGKPVQLQMVKDDYRQGTRDYLPIVEKTKKDVYINIDEVMDFILSEKNKAMFGGGKKMNYFPTRRFRLAVDKNKVIENGTVPADRANRIVDALEWQVKGQYILKSEMVILDILSQNQWERPIYFANTMPRDSYFGLEQYMQHEGFAYRLVPYIIQPDQNQYGYFGEVASDIMYNNMMNEFEFGGMEDPDIFLDENNLRFVTNLRLNFSRLSSALVREGKQDSAKAVMDRCVEITVNSNTPKDVTLIQMVENYFKIGANEEAVALAEQVSVNYIEHLRYYLRLEGKMRNAVNRDMGQAYAVLQQMKTYATQYEATEFQAFIDPIFAEAEELIQASGLNQNRGARR